jgi:O-antigen ligase
MFDSPNGRPISWFSLAQRCALMLTIFIAVISSPRIMLLDIEPLANIPLEFRAVTLALPDFVLLLLIAFTAIRLVAEGRYAEDLLATTRLLLSRGLIFWIASVVWTGMSTLWSFEAIMTRFVTIHVAASVLMAILLADLIRREGSRGLIWGLVFSAVLQAVIGVAQSLNGNPLGLGALGELPRFSYDTDRFFRAAGLSQHPNYLGGYLMLGVLACLLMAWQTQRWRWFILSLASVCGVGLIATLSRSAILGTGVALLPVMIVLLRSLDAARRHVIVTGIVVLIMIGVTLALIATHGDIQTRFLTGREFFFEDSWREIQRSPLLGTGAGALMLTINSHRSQRTDVLPVHNVYLYVWAEAGIVGLALFVLACGAILWQIRQHPTALVWSCTFLSVCVTMLFDNYWWAIHPFQIVFFWIVGYWWGITLPQHERPREPQSDQGM